MAGDPRETPPTVAPGGGGDYSYNLTHTTACFAEALVF